MKIMKKMKMVVLAVLVFGTMAVGGEAQGRGVDGFFLPLPPSSIGCFFLQRPR